MYGNKLIHESTDWARQEILHQQEGKYKEDFDIRGSIEICCLSDHKRKMTMIIRKELSQSSS